MPNEIEALRPVGSTINQFAPIPISLRCPHCGKVAMLNPVGLNDLMYMKKVDQARAITVLYGIRQCPNTDCSGLTTILRSEKSVLILFPSEEVEFNAENIPSAISTTFREAIRCHSSGCYVASAMMVRKTLEELCEDKGATGPNLHERLKSLTNIIVIPQALATAAIELKLLGNDAAHVEAKSYDGIGKEETTVAIDLAKELLKATYQLDDLVARLRLLKKK